MLCSACPVSQQHFRFEMWLKGHCMVYPTYIYIYSSMKSTFFASQPPSCPGFMRSTILSKWLRKAHWWIAGPHPQMMEAQTWQRAIFDIKIPYIVKPQKRAIELEKNPCPWSRIAFPDQSIKTGSFIISCLCVCDPLYPEDVDALDVYSGRGRAVSLGFRHGPKIGGGAGLWESL